MENTENTSTIEQQADDADIRTDRADAAAVDVAGENEKTDVAAYAQ